MTHQEQFNKDSNNHPGLPFNTGVVLEDKNGRDSYVALNVGNKTTIEESIKTNDAVLRPGRAVSRQRSPHKKHTSRRRHYRSESPHSVSRFAEVQGHDLSGTSAGHRLYHSEGRHHHDRSSDLDDRRLEALSNRISNLKLQCRGILSLQTGLSDISGMPYHQSDYPTPTSVRSMSRLEYDFDSPALAVSMRGSYPPPRRMSSYTYPYDNPYEYQRYMSRSEIDPRQSSHYFPNRSPSPTPSLTSLSIASSSRSYLASPAEYSSRSIEKSTVYDYPFLDGHPHSGSKGVMSTSFENPIFRGGSSPPSSVRHDIGISGVKTAAMQKSSHASKEADAHVSHYFKGNSDQAAIKHSSAPPSLDFPTSSVRNKSVPADELLDANSAGFETIPSPQFVPYAKKSVEDLGPEECRWFYKTDVDKKWIPFIGYDSLRIEWKYRDLIQNNAKSSTKLHDISKYEDTGADRPFELGKDGAVTVRGALYEVDVKSRRGQSIYWKGEVFIICRGIWFYEGPWSPLEEADAEKIEIEHLKHFRGHNLINSSGLDTHKSVIHSIAVTEGSVEWFSPSEVYLSLDATPARLMRSVGKKLGFQKTGYKIHRGYSQDAGVGDKPPDINHLVFVIHGIGQKMDTGRIFKNCTALRDNINALKQRYLREQQLSNGEATSMNTVEFFPVEWRSSLTLDSGLIDLVTPQTILNIRQMLNSSFMDIMYYKSPQYREEIVTGLSSELNRLYTMFTERNPYFEANGGRVSIVSHSLGCVITYDIITGWSPTPHFSANFLETMGSFLNTQQASGASAQQLQTALQRLLHDQLQHSEQPHLNFKVSNLFCLGSPLAVFLALRWKQASGAPPMQSKGRIGRVFNIFHPADPVAYRLEPLLCSTYTNIAPVTIHYHGSVEKTPYSQMPLEPLQANKDPEQGGENMATQAANQALASSQPTTPSKGSNSSSWTIWGLMKGGTKKAELYDSQIAGALNSASSGFNNLWPSGPPVPSTVILDQSGLRLSESQRIDFVLREGSMENSYISALTSHTAYWSNMDVAHFLLSALYPNKVYDSLINNTLYSRGNVLKVDESGDETERFLNAKHLRGMSPQVQSDSMFNTSISKSPAMSGLGVNRTHLSVSPNTSSDSSISPIFDTSFRKVDSSCRDVNKSNQLLQSGDSNHLKQLRTSSPNLALDPATRRMESPISSVRMSSGAQLPMSNKTQALSGGSSARNEAFSSHNADCSSSINRRNLISSRAESGRIDTGRMNLQTSENDRLTSTSINSVVSGDNFSRTLTGNSQIGPQANGDATFGSRALEQGKANVLGSNATGLEMKVTLADSNQTQLSGVGSTFHSQTSGGLSNIRTGGTSTSCSMPTRISNMSNSVLNTSNLISQTLSQSSTQFNSSVQSNVNSAASSIMSTNTSSGSLINNPSSSCSSSYNINLGGTIPMNAMQLTTCLPSSVPMTSGLSSTVPMNRGISSNLTTSSGLSQNLPVGSGLSCSLPVSSGLSTNLAMNSGPSANMPLNTNLPANIPLNTGLSTSMPLSSGLGTNMPMSGGLATNMPMSGSLATNMPMSGGLATNMSMSGSQFTNIPVGSSLSTNMPVSNANMQMNSGISINKHISTGLSTNVSVPSGPNAQMRGGLSSNMTIGSGLSTNMQGSSIMPINSTGSLSNMPQGTSAGPSKILSFNTSPNISSNLPQNNSNALSSNIVMNTSNMSFNSAMNSSGNLSTNTNPMPIGTSGNFPVNSMSFGSSSNATNMYNPAITGSGNLMSSSSTMSGGYSTMQTAFQSSSSGVSTMPAAGGTNLYGSGAVGRGVSGGFMGSSVQYGGSQGVSLMSMRGGYAKPN